MELPRGTDFLPGINQVLSQAEKEIETKATVPAMQNREPRIAQGTINDYWNGAKQWINFPNAVNPLIQSAVADFSTRAWVNQQIALALNSIVDGAPTAFDTLREIAAELGSEKTLINSLLTAIETKLAKNAAISSGTRTKITYDANGLIIGGADATTADINDTLDRRYVTDAQKSLFSQIRNSRVNVTPVQTGIAGLAIVEVAVTFTTAFQNTNYVISPSVQITAAGGILNVDSIASLAKDKCIVRVKNVSLNLFSGTAYLHTTCTPYNGNF